MYKKSDKDTIELYETISRMFNSLKKKEDLSNNEIDRLVDLFRDTSASLQCMMIPYTLKTKKENILKETINDYREYLENFGQLTRFLISFSAKLQQKPIDERDGKFSCHIDESIKDVVDFYESTMINENESKQVNRVKKSYFAFLMLSRALNNAIINYNKDFPNYKVTELKNIPEPKSLNLDNVDLLQYVKDVESKKIDLFS